MGCTKHGDGLLSHIERMTPIAADVIFPAFTAPYVSPLLFPVAGVAAISTEWFCYRRLSSDKKYPNLGDIIPANLVS
jgi:hypothetical protein